MQPQQLDQSLAQPKQPAAEKKKVILLPIVLILWPGALIILTIIGYSLLNYFASLNTPAPSTDPQSLFGEEASSPLRSVTNVFLFLFGAASMTVGPISFIVGIVLLVKRLTARKNA